MVQRVWINSKPDMRMIVSLPGYDAGPQLADEYKSLDSNWSPLRIVQRVQGYWVKRSGSLNIWYAKIDNFFVYENYSYLVFIRYENGPIRNLYGSSDNTYNVWSSDEEFSGNPGIPIIGVIFEMSS